MVYKFNIVRVSHPKSEQIRIYSSFRYADFNTNRKKNIRKNTLESRNRSNSRAKRRINELIHANFSVGFSFVTLTFRENIQDISLSNAIFSNFIRRLKYYLKCKTDLAYSFKYICTIETQKRGAFHYHIICNLPHPVSFSEIISLWNKAIDSNICINKKGGTVKIQYIEPDEKLEELSKVSHYISKYMTKSEVNHILCGKKTYFTSKNLLQPIRTNHIMNPNFLKYKNKEEIHNMIKTDLLDNSDLVVSKSYSYIDKYTDEEILYIEYI